MIVMRVLSVVAAVTVALLAANAQAQTKDPERVVARHMIAEAMLAAHFVAMAERAGMGSDQINAILTSIADQSGVDEFWITDSRGRAYLTNIPGVDFKFSPDPAKQPQASAFWPLLQGRKRVVVQRAQKREIDDRIFKYVGVAGVDKPRIVQIGVSADHLPRCP
jgi:hypothetical protein